VEGGKEQARREPQRAHDAAVRLEPAWLASLRFVPPFRNRVRVQVRVTREARPTHMRRGTIMRNRQVGPGSGLLGLGPGTASWADADARPHPAWSRRVRG
jgi:hypothetical protein